MLLTEYDETRTMEMFKREGREEGIKAGLIKGLKEGRGEGEARLGTLITRLISLGRTDEIAKAASDPAFRDKLYAEFGMA